MADPKIPHLADLRDLNQLAPRMQTPKGYLGADGLQNAHLSGTRYWNDFYEDLLKVIDPGRTLQPNLPFNVIHAPEIEAGGMTLGTWTHRGQQYGAFDRLVFDSTPGRNTQQYLNGLLLDTNRLTQELKSKLASAENQSPEKQSAIKAEIEKVQADARLKFVAFHDFFSVHGLNQDILDKYEGQYGRKLITLEFNSAGAQGGTDALGTYLAWNGRSGQAATPFGDLTCRATSAPIFPDGTLTEHDGGNG
jgi:hypothetical protein